MSDWQDATEPWDRHPHAAWRETLERARQARWYFRKFSDHGWGAITCDKDAPEGERCYESISSTALGTENVARDTYRDIPRCPHRLEPEKSPEAIAERLDRARCLVDAAETFLKADEKGQLARDLLKEAEAGLDEGELLLDEAALEEEAEQALLASARSSAEEGRASAPIRASAAAQAAKDLLEEASARTSEVRKDIGDCGLRQAVRRKLSDRCRDLRQRIEVLRKELR